MTNTSEKSGAAGTTQIAEARVVLEDSGWGRLIPWIMTVASLAVLVALAWFLIDNLTWFRAHAFPPNTIRDGAFTLYAFHLHLAMVKRSVALFAGFALIFVGTAVAFYSLRLGSDLEGKSAAFSGKLSTASPGVIAMVLGTLLIMFTIYSKDQFESLPDDASVGAPERAPTKLVQPDVAPQ